MRWGCSLPWLMLIVQVMIRVWTILLSLLGSVLLHGQQESLLFTHFEKKDGLNQSSVNCIFQDSRDFLWIANFGGVNRFDGYNMLSYENDFDDGHSIASNSVWAIYETDDGELWFGTKSGLSQFMRASNNFLNYSITDPEITASILAVKAIFEDSDNKLYIGTEGKGIQLFDRVKKTFLQTGIVPEDSKVSSITQDNRGNLWVGTENRGLFKYDVRQAKSVSLKDDGIISDDTIWALYFDLETESLFIGTDSKGLIQLNVTTNDPFVFLTEMPGQYALGKKIKSIEKGRPGELWIGSATHGLGQLDLGSLKIFYHNFDPNNENSIQDNDVSSIHYGSHDVLFIGYYMKGFDKVIKTPFHRLQHDPLDLNSLSHNNVYCSYLDSDGDLWFGTFGGGLNRYDHKKSSFEHYRSNINDPESISSDWVRIIRELSDGEFWIGTWGGGLNRFDKSTGKFRSYLSDPDNPNALSHDIITAIFEDADGDVLIGTYGGGINIYRPQTDDFEIIQSVEDDVRSLSDNHITSFVQDESGMIWVCTYGGGINLFDKSSRTFERIIPIKEDPASLNHHNVLHMYRDADSSFYWVTTLGGGLNKFYPESRRFKHFTTRDGLSNNSTMGMLKDDYETYWISTNQGLSRFDSASASFVNFDIHDGLSNDDFNLEAYSQLPDGIMYFGNKEGVNYFDPGSISTAEGFPRLGVTNVKVEEETLIAAERKVKVPYKSRIRVEFAAINPDKTSKIEYAYKLDGEHNTWSQVGDLRTIEFSNLAPGNHKLLLRSTNSDGIWNDVPTEFMIDVPTPWYMTVLFRLFTAFLIITAVAFYYLRKLKIARQQNIILEQRVAERTETINQKNLDLIEKNRIIDDQRADLSSLNKLKDKILGVISHDMKTPLINLNMMLNVFDREALFENKDEFDSYVGIVNKELGKVEGLLDNLLMWAKYQMKNVRVLRTNSDIGQIIDDVASLAEGIINKKNLQLNINNEIDKEINCDSNIISFIVRNLLNNAIKFTPSGGSITINAHHVDKKIEISVSDSGVGMDDDQIEKLFTDDIQWKLGTEGEVGSGLGLQLCQNFARLHDGLINVESKKNKGTTFTLSFTP